MHNRVFDETRLSREGAGRGGDETARLNRQKAKNHVHSRCLSKKKKKIQIVFLKRKTIHFQDLQNIVCMCRLNSIS